jgi:hypothetical protein
LLQLFLKNSTHKVKSQNYLHSAPSKNLRNTQQNVEQLTVITKRIDNRRRRPPTRSNMPRESWIKDWRFRRTTLLYLLYLCVNVNHPDSMATSSRWRLRSFTFLGLAILVHARKLCAFQVVRQSAKSETLERSIAKTASAVRDSIPNAKNRFVCYWKQNNNGKVC